MANNVDFTTYINNFQNAIYGEEVRGSLVAIARALQTACNNQLIEVDTTLTQSGAGADAKTVGEKALWYRGVIDFDSVNPINVDLNDYIDIGIWHITTNAARQNGYVLNLPDGVTTGGQLIVLRHKNRAALVQVYITWANAVYVRSRLSATDWTEWGSLPNGAIIENNFAAPYSNASTYFVGQYCIYNDRTYRCISAINTPEEWDDAHWTRASVGASASYSITPYLSQVTSSTIDAVTGGSRSCDDFPYNSIVTVSTSDFELLNAPPSSQLGTYLTYGYSPIQSTRYGFVQIHVSSYSVDIRYKTSSRWTEWQTMPSTDAVDTAISNSHYAVDEYGSVFSSQNELYLYHQSIEYCPEYEYHFGDFINKTWGTTLEELSGWSNANHPIPYDDSLVIELEPGYYSSPLYVFMGKIVDGVFEPLTFLAGLQDSTFSGLGNNVPRYYVAINALARRYVDTPSDLDDMYIVVGATSVGYASGVFQHFTIKRNNTDAKLVGVHLVSLVNSNVPRFVGSESDPKHCIYYTEIDVESPLLLPGQAKYLYAQGLPIDAIFYDKNRSLIQGSVGDMRVYDATAGLPSLIKVPEGAKYYRMAVYGRRAISPRGVRDFGASILEDYPKVQAYVKAEHAPIPSRDIGQTIYNANKLMNFTYEASQIPTRYMNLNNASGKGTDGSDIYRSRARGFVYGKRTPNIYISYYTYLTMYRFIHGYSATSQSPTSSNSFFGFVCVSFISACLGFDFLEGTEWWLQNYASKLEAIDRNTVLNVGDLVVMQTYYHKKYSNKPSLYTHLQLVTDVLYDPETGDFVGYKTAECTNIWTRDVVKLNSGFTGRLPSSGDVTPQEGVQCERSWRISVPITAIPKVDEHYRFAIDRELDTLNHGLDIEMPPCVCWSGDMCLIGPHPNEWSQSNPYTIVYVDEKYAYVKVYRNEAYVTTLTKADSDKNIISGYDRYDLVDYLTEPGVYELYCSEDGISYDAKPGTFYLPDYPTCTISGDAKSVAISGITPVLDDDNNVVSVRTDSFDEIWVRVMPYPVSEIDGFSAPPPYANYIYVNGAELWDGEKLSVGERYQYIISLTFINDVFGGIDRKFSGDYTPNISDNDDTDSDNDKDDPTDTSVV